MAMPGGNGFGTLGAGPEVVVLGGGFGGLETAFDLRMLAGDRARITLVSDLDHFFFKPNSIYVPFGLDPKRLRVPLARPPPAGGWSCFRHTPMGSMSTPNG
jgi:sulfide:quinone oxidoreductase